MHADPVHALSHWYETHARKLPWRETRDPYAIWISEVMLQQTQVATVIPYYHRFLQSFPTLSTLSAAEESEVLARWSGLGYYSRAKNLRKGAQYCVVHHGGHLPRNREAMLEVPGIGPYTAGAILSIAFDQRVPLVDGNVQRVFARYFAIDAPLQASATQKRFWAKAESWVQQCASPRMLNQALMELGATVCIKGKPRCEQCPIAASCAALRLGQQELLPRKKDRPDKVDLWWVSVVLEAEGKFFLQKNAKGTWWSDLWDFPHWQVPDREAWLHATPPPVAGLLVQNGTEPSVAHHLLSTQRHTVTHHRVHVAPHLVHFSQQPAQLPWDGEWFTADALRDAPISSLVRKLFAAHHDRDRTLC